MIFVVFVFLVMGVCVKLVLVYYSIGEIVFYCSVIGMILMGVILVKIGVGICMFYFMVYIKCSVFGVILLLLWFILISLLLLVMVMMLNYMLLVWIVLIIGVGVVMVGRVVGVDKKMVVVILMLFVGVLCLL